MTLGGVYYQLTAASNCSGMKSNGANIVCTMNLCLILSGPVRDRSIGCSVTINRVFDFKTWNTVFQDKRKHHTNTGLSLPETEASSPAFRTPHWDLHNNALVLLSSLCRELCFLLGFLSFSKEVSTLVKGPVHSSRYHSYHLVFSKFSPYCKELKGQKRC